MSNPIYRSQYDAAQIEAAIGKGPRINASGYWEVWNVAAGAYESTGVGAGVTPPTVVTQVSQMTNHGYVYIYNGSETGYTPGYWYYWNGSAWTAGGAYQVAATDPTLSVAGAAADAKATGDVISTLSGATTLTGYTVGYGYRTSGTSVNIASPEANSVLNCIYVECNPGDVYTFTGRGSSNFRTYVFLAADGTIVGSKGPATAQTNLVITVISGAKYIAFNVRNDAPYVIWKGVFTEKQNVLTFDDMPEEDSKNPVTSDGVYAVQYAFETLHGVTLIEGYQRGKGYNTSGGTVDINSPTAISNVMCTYADCTPGEKFTYTGYGSTSYRAYAFLDGDGAILGSLPPVKQYKNIVITAPANATHVIFNQRNHEAHFPYAVWRGVYDGENHSYGGCKMSLLGDSISAFEGYSTDGHKYYPNSGSDVSDVSEMWWYKVADYFQMTPLVIGGWSGSTVASGIRSASTYTPASDPSRCEALHSGTDNPDVVLIAMGVNDYSYDDAESDFGTWDGTTALGSAADLSDYATGDFRRAYATMLARIQYRYPSAFIICITPWFVERYSTDTGANYLNAIGKSLTDYAEAVRDICKIMHVACIDGTDIGFNRYNYYPTYCIDSPTKPTHPNVAGQDQMAKAIIEQMLTLHRLGA